MRCTGKPLSELREKAAAARQLAERARKSLGSKVVDGKLRYVSPSGIKTWRDCPRKWGIRYIDRKEEPESKAQRIGKDGHARIEHYCQTGDDVLTDLELSGKIWIPGVWQSPIIEPPIVLSRPLTVLAGVPLIGRLDLLSTWGSYIDPQGNEVEDARAEVVDWKFTSDPAKWALKPNEILDDLAMNSYAEFARSVGCGDDIRLSIVSFSTKKFFAMKRTCVTTPAQTAAVFAKALATVEDMKREVASATCGNDLPLNLDACGKYGGCKYGPLGHCHKSKLDAIRMLVPGFDVTPLETPTGGNDLSDSLLNLVLGDTPPEPAPPPAAEPPSDMQARLAALQAPQEAAKAAHDIGAEVAQLMARVELYGKGIPAIVGGLAKQIGDTDGRAGTGDLAQMPIGRIEELRELVDGLAVRFPDKAAALDNAAANVPGLSPPDAPTVTVAQAADPVDVAETLSLSPAVAEQVAASTPPPVAEVKKPGRPPKPKKMTKAQALERVKELEAMIAAGGGGSVDVTNYDAAHEAALRTVQKRDAEIADLRAKLLQTSPTVGAVALEVWVDCVPIGAPMPTSLDPYVDTITTALAKKAGAPHILAAPNESQLAYGRWAGLLTLSVGHAPPQAGRYVLLHTKGDAIREAVVDGLRGVDGIVIHRSVA